MATQMNRLSDPAWAKVVDAHQVEHETLCGWRVDKVIEQEHVEVIHETIPMIRPGDSYVSQSSATKGAVVKRTQFLMVMGREDALIRETNAKRKIETELQEVKDAKSALEKALKVKTDEVMQETAARAREERHYDELRTRHTQMESIKQKMENDLSKVRLAIGDLRMKEIIGS